MSTELDVFVMGVFETIPETIKIKKGKTLPISEKMSGMDVPISYQLKDPSREIAAVRGDVSFKEDKWIVLQGYGPVLVHKETKLKIGDDGSISFSRSPYVPSRVVDKANNILGYPTRKAGKLELDSHKPSIPSNDAFAPSVSEPPVSYERTKNRIVKITKKLGKGTSGSVKEIESVAKRKADGRYELSSQLPTALCFKTILIPNEISERVKEQMLSAVRQEIELLEQAGHKIAEPIYIQSAKGLKIVIPIKNFGVSLSALSNAQTSREKKLFLSTGIFQELRRFHLGDAFSDRGVRVHCDVKPANLSFDGKKVTLIDFGSAKTYNFENPEKVQDKGTMYYLPVDASRFEEGKPGFGDINQNATVVDADLIAAVRSIYNPVYKKTQISLFSHDEFKQLPEALQNLLDTRDITRYLEKKIDLNCLEAALFVYQVTGKLEQRTVDIIKNDLQICSVLCDLSQKLSDKNDGHYYEKGIPQEEKEQLITEIDELRPSSPLNRQDTGVFNSSSSDSTRDASTLGYSESSEDTTKNSNQALEDFKHFLIDQLFRLLPSELQLIVNHTEAVTSYFELNKGSIPSTDKKSKLFDLLNEVESHLSGPGLDKNEMDNLKLKIADASQIKQQFTLFGKKSDSTTTFKAFKEKFLANQEEYKQFVHDLKEYQAKSSL